MKVVFLDIDGVLNVVGQGHDEYGQIFHKHLEKNLEQLIDRTGAKIVISSTWRKSGLEVMQSMWAKRGLPGVVIDVTPDLTKPAKWGTLDYFQAVIRGEEIKAWLNKHPEVTKYVILDDDSDMLEEQKDYFVRTAGNQHHADCVDIGYGLTRECAEMAIKILNNESE